MRNDSASADLGGLRVDKWLWYTRFFKSRSLATNAVTGGLVHVDGERVKPSRTVLPGAQLQITRGEERFEVIVKTLPSRRGPAAEAQQAYDETELSAQNRARKQEQLRIAPPAPMGRPGKHDRRALRGLRGRHD